MRNNDSGGKRSRSKRQETGEQGQAELPSARAMKPTAEGVRRLDEAAAGKPPPSATPGFQINLLEYRLMVFKHIALGIHGEKYVERLEGEMEVTVAAINEALSRNPPPWKPPHGP
jgi:hypothetical protein